MNIMKKLSMAFGVWLYCNAAVLADKIWIMEGEFQDEWHQIILAIDDTSLLKIDSSIPGFGTVLNIHSSADTYTPLEPLRLVLYERYELQISEEQVQISVSNSDDLYALLDFFMSGQSIIEVIDAAEYSMDLNSLNENTVTLIGPNDDSSGIVTNTDPHSDRSSFPTGYSNR
ncbi:MAG: hypothetical protein AAGB12_03635 [Pseudomonadota bacterium]